MRGGRASARRRMESRMERRTKLMKIRDEWNAFLKDDSGLGTIEVVLILVVLIGLVIIFKKQITTLLESIFKQINSKAKEVY